MSSGSSIASTPLRRVWCDPSRLGTDPTAQRAEFRDRVDADVGRRTGRQDSLGTFGTCGIVGATKQGTEVAFNVNEVMIAGRRILGIVQGDVVAKTFIPILVDLYKQGRFPFDRLVRFYSFDDINQAVEDSERGVTIKPILRIGQAA